LKVQLSYPWASEHGIVPDETINFTEVCFSNQPARNSLKFTAIRKSAYREV